MKVHFARRFTVLAVVAVTLPAGLVTANAAATVPVAEWTLNTESPNARQMFDSGPNGFHGDIQANAAPMLTTGVSYDGEKIFRWENVQPNQPPTKPQRVVQIDDAGLNPGTDDWAISFRYRTSRPFGNIMQKGQATTRGGQIKFQLPQGNVSCMYKGSLGRRAVRSVGAYDDNAWHVVRCERTGNRVELSIWNGDGSGQPVETRRINGPTGTISNTVPMTVGGKINCNQVNITCDYFAGDIDWIKVESS